MESGREELEKKCEVSVANATINTVVADELLRVKGSGARQAGSKAIEEEKSPKIKKTNGVSLERIESLTALAFNPKKAKPGPKRSSLLIKQGFSNVSQARTSKP